tara:strand:- start:144 stop:311 length:168 start_codon:yes stop_codon:yes gene_type:complete
MGIYRLIKWFRHYYATAQQSAAPIVKHGPGGDYVFGLDPVTGEWQPVTEEVQNEH